jgi:hypothetical protein
MADYKPYTPEEVKIQNLLKTVANHFDQEDRSARERQLRNWRRLKLLWEGFQRVWYSEVAHDWRIWDEEINSADNDQAFYDKPVNVFRAYLESIIAALSITIPGIKCYPDDADEPLDLQTAKAGDKIAQLVYRHNDAPLLWLHALYIFCTEGMTAYYAYPKEDEKYGTYKEDEYKYQNVGEAYICPVCNSRLADDVFTAQETDEFQPDDNDVLVHDIILNEHQAMCPQCGAMLDPDLQKSPLIVQRLTGQKTLAKSRICIECYGGLYVKVPNYAMKQEDVPYLIFSYETHYSNALERYPRLRDRFTGNDKIGPSGGGMYDPYEQWARLSPQYRGEYPTNNVTVRNCWLRPSSFNVLGNKEDVELLKKEYPDGAKLVLINDEYADDCNESLDDCWTILKNPMADYIHYYPLGSLLVSVQDITNDLISLTLQTIEHGIQQTFADPGVLNFERYRQAEAMPGGVYPAVPKTGKSMNDAFFETRTATLSPEVFTFFESMQMMGQTVSGAQPSLFGGQLSGSRTASEYSMSRAQALQRLQNTWKMFTMCWKQVFSKVIPMFIQEMKEDEKSVERDRQGNFLNVFIRKAELEGKIGRVELEANENLPITWSQRKDVYMQLLDKQNPQILEALASPENIKNLAEAIGLDDFVVPGEDSRQKQYEEIKALINSEPIVQPATEEEVLMQVAQGQQPQLEKRLPSVEIDPDLDNHDIEAEICRIYLISDAGRLLKIENPPGYENVLLHYKAHMEQIKLSMMQQQMAAQPQQPAPKGTNQPLTENDNAAVES